MADSLDVRLHDLQVGELIRLQDGRTRFEFNSRYVDMPQRPTLSLSFIHGLNRVTYGTGNTARSATSGRVPTFFSNLLPEGRLRNYVASAAGVKPTREFDLLAYVGNDLPGAVELIQSDQLGQRSAPSSQPGILKKTDFSPRNGVKFSLAGVELKYSALTRAHGGLTIPASGSGGNWIVKLPSSAYPLVPENEFSVMKLASKVGINIPEIRLVPIGQIEGLPREMHAMKLASDNAIAIKRFDRDNGKRVHSEDFAQVLGVLPENKYDDFNYGNLATVLSVFSGKYTDTDEFARRLMFAALIGNGDLHLKNWSLIYRDQIHPELSPTYDMLCTSCYTEDDNIALRLGSSKRWRDLTLGDFSRIATQARINAKGLVNAARDVAVQFWDVWEQESRELPIPDFVSQTIHRQRRVVRAIRSSLNPS